MEDEEPTDVTDTTDWSRFNQIKKITQNGMNWTHESVDDNCD